MVLWVRVAKKRQNHRSPRAELSNTYMTAKHLKDEIGVGHSSYELMMTSGGRGS